MVRTSLYCSFEGLCIFNWVFKMQFQNGAVSFSHISKKPSCYSRGCRGMQWMNHHEEQGSLRTERDQRPPEDFFTVLPQVIKL